jgi:hypothetical protein
LQEAELSTLTVQYPCLPATSPEIRNKLIVAQQKLMMGEQVPIQTDHVIHGGMYARTVTMPPNTVLIGAHIKRATLVITVGSAKVLVGRDWADVDGYQVLPASADRKQIFISRGPFVITMLFPTQAKTVEEAEAEFTDEAELLLSRKQDLNSITITGE